MCVTKHALHFMVSCALDGVLCPEWAGLAPTWEVVTLLGSTTRVLECDPLVSEATGLFFDILAFLFCICLSN